MKYHKLTKVQVPVIVDGDRQWIAFRFTGTLDSKRIIREVRKYFKMWYNHSYKKEHFRRYATILNAYDKIAVDAIGHLIEKDIAGCWIQEFMEREKELANKDNGNSVIQEDDTRKTTVQMCFVSD
jgi:hypothetical protein